MMSVRVNRGLEERGEEYSPFIPVLVLYGQCCHAAKTSASHQIIKQARPIFCLFQNGIR